MRQVHAQKNAGWLVFRTVITGDFRHRIYQSFCGCTWKIKDRRGAAYEMLELWF
jgi:hypothetical protein